MILFIKANSNDDGENSDCIERTTMGFFKSFRTVVLILELYHGANDRYIDFDYKQRQ